MSDRDSVFAPPRPPSREPVPADQRRHPRVELDLAPLALEVSGSAAIPAMIVNLSEGGLAVETRCALPEDARVRFRAPGLAVAGYAVVKRCTAARGRYRSGLAIEPESVDPTLTLRTERLSQLLQIEILVLNG